MAFLHRRLLAVAASPLPLAFPLRIRRPFHTLQPDSINGVGVSSPTSPPPPRSCGASGASSARLELPFPPLGASSEDYLRYCVMLEKKNMKVTEELHKTSMSLALLKAELAAANRTILQVVYKMEIRGILSMFTATQGVYIDGIDKTPTTIRREKWDTILLLNVDFVKCLERRIPSLYLHKHKVEFICMCEEHFHSYHHRVIQ